MITNEQLKQFARLKNKRHRYAEGKFIVEGTKLVNEGIESWFTCELLLMTHEYASGVNPPESELKELTHKLRQKNIRFELIKNKELEKLTDTENPQGIIALFSIPPVRPLAHKGIIVALENISDPGNVGTILRNCDWFGIKEVVLSRECADIYNPKVIRASMGSIFHINVASGQHLPAYIENLKQNGYKILTADMNGENIHTARIDGKKLLLVLSNESAGPSSSLLGLTDIKLTIPRFGKAESLNVASASAVLMAKLRSLF